MVTYTPSCLDMTRFVGTRMRSAETCLTRHDRISLAETEVGSSDVGSSVGTYLLIAAHHGHRLVGSFPLIWSGS